MQPDYHIDLNGAVVSMLTVNWDFGGSNPHRRSFFLFKITLSIVRVD